MYKVFIENRSVNFLQNDQAKTGLHSNVRKDNYFREDVLSQILTHEPGTEVSFHCVDPEAVFQQFFAKYISVEAAGGIVEKEGNLLFIKRFGMWDLPKGKIEKNEGIQQGAIREVEEECGLIGVHIKAPIDVTLHTYSSKGKMYLKRTHWFAMECQDLSFMKPQENEGITELRWFGYNQLDEVKRCTYLSICQVIKSYLDPNDR